jgi:hypothetical protein
VASAAAGNAMLLSAPTPAANSQPAMQRKTFFLITIAFLR